MTWLWLGLAGGLGAVARHAVGQAMLSWAASGFPLGTLLINVAGSFLLGFLAGGGAGASRWAAPQRLAVTVGFLGAFTTFSTFSVDTVQLWLAGRPWLAAANVAISVAAGLLGAWAGLRLAALALPRG